MTAQSISVTVTHQRDFQFLVDFGNAHPGVMADEPPPLGQGSGPAPTHLLAAAVANCLSASFYFALGKFKQEAGGIKTTANCVIERNDDGRLRVRQIDVEIRFGKTGEQVAHLDRVLEQFENFCTVTQSVQTGIPVSVWVFDGSGTRLK